MKSFVKFIFIGIVFITFISCFGDNSGSDKSPNSDDPNLEDPIGNGNGNDTSFSWVTIFLDPLNSGTLATNYDIDSGLCSITFDIKDGSAVYDNSTCYVTAIRKGDVAGSNIRTSIKFKLSSIEDATVFLIGPRTTGPNPTYYVIDIHSATDGKMWFLIGDINTKGDGKSQFYYDRDADPNIDKGVIVANTTYILELAVLSSEVIGYLKKSNGDIIAKLTLNESNYAGNGGVGFGVVCKYGPVTISLNDFKAEKSN